MFFTSTYIVYLTFSPFDSDKGHSDSALHPGTTYMHTIPISLGSDFRNFLIFVCCEVSGGEIDEKFTNLHLQDR